MFIREGVAWCLIANVSPKYVSKLSSRTGRGTLIRRDDENFLLSDVACVTCSQIQHMQTCLPQLKVQVLSSEASTSGFMLILSVSTQHTVAAVNSCVHMGMQLFLFVLFFAYLLQAHAVYIDTA